MPEDIKRYNLKMSQSLYDELDQLATVRGVAVVDVIRAFIKLGLLANKPGNELLVREPDGTERTLEIII